MMRMNGVDDSGESSGTEVVDGAAAPVASVPGDTMSVVVSAWNDMIEADNSSLRERVHDLEKKVLDQGDEIICLRSTLANVVRRLEQIEGYARSGDAPTRYHRNGSNSYVYKGSLRQPGYITASATDASKEPARRVNSYSSNSSLPQRRQVHYQSTGSLHSQHSSHSNHSNHSVHSAHSAHSESPSSSSVSPVPTSPSPTLSSHPGILRHPPASSSTSASTPNSFRLTEPTRSISQTSTPVRTVSNLSNSKRWSSTGDFAHSVSTVSTNSVSRYSAKSLLNLSKLPHLGSNNHSGMQHKHGTQGASWDPDEGALRIYLRGRPIVLYAPTALIDSYDLSSVATAPSLRLKLDWVYGYRGRDCRSNLYFLPTGEMVYFIAAAVVLYNAEEQTQRHYLGHTDDVKCLTVHPNKMLVATGQCAGHDRRDARPHIRIWNTVNLHTVAVIGMNDFDKAVSCVSFSKADGGSLLVAIDESTDHNISVWDWQKGEHGAKITETKCSVDTVVAAEFHPLDRNCIVTCGKSHVNFWVLDQNGTLYKRMGIFENRDKPKYVTCLAFLQNGDTLSGDSNGNIIVWGQGTNTILKLVKNVHEGPIFSLCVLKDGSVVSGGGKDGRLVLLDNDLQSTGEETIVGESYGSVRHIAEGRGDQLLIGTTRNCILVGSVSVGLTPVVIGHTEELWGCAAHPSLAQFATAGFDATLCLWDSMAHSLVWSKQMPEQVQSVSFSPDGSLLVVGYTSGRWQALDVVTRDTVSSHLDGSEPIQCVRFSPDGRLLALGSRDNTIYVYQVSEDGVKYSRVGRCVGHSSFITHVDWSADSQIIRSNSGDYELLYWQADVCRQITQSASLRDVEWASNNCTLTFQTVGIWPDGVDGTDVNNCARSSDCRLMVTADDFGKVKIYSYPVSQPKSLCHVMGGHSSHVTQVEFLQDDSRIVSTGGKDMSVMQWRLS